MRLNVIVLTGVLLGLGAAVYNVADRVQEKEKKIGRLNQRIAHEEESLRVLGAEWTYLTNPERLEKIAAKHLNLVPMDGRQYIALTAVPMRAVLDEEENQLAQAEAPPPSAPSYVPPSMVSASSAAAPAALPRKLSLTQISMGGPR